MHRARYSLLVGLLTLGGTFGCGTEMPTIAVGRTALDVGEIPQAPVQATTRIANVGRGTLRVLAVSTSCGCTQAWVSDSVLAPGEATTLTVRYDPTTMMPGDTGRVHRGIYVQTNDRLRPEVQFDLYAVVHPGAVHP